MSTAFADNYEDTLDFTSSLASHYPVLSKLVCLRRWLGGFNHVGGGWLGHGRVKLLSLRVLLQSDDGQEYRLNPPFRENLLKALCASNKTPWQVSHRQRVLFVVKRA